LCSSRKYPYSPHRRDWKFQGGWGASKDPNFKAMYVAKHWNFQRGGGVIGQIPSTGGGGGYGYSLELHIRKNVVTFNIIFMKTTILKIVIW